MKKVLFVDCCIRRGESRSKQLADHFLSEVQKNGEYEVETLCLMDENLSYQCRTIEHELNYQIWIYY